jgi:hypothetical protein
LPPSPRRRRRMPPAARLGAPQVEVLGNVKFDICCRRRSSWRRARRCARGWARARCCSPPARARARRRCSSRRWRNFRWRGAAPRRAAPPAALRRGRRTRRPGRLRVQRRSENAPVAAQTQVLLGDSMGEMFAYYAACDVAFVGGSLLDYGSQNLIEPCAVGKAGADRPLDLQLHARGRAGAGVRRGAADRHGGGTAGNGAGTAARRGRAPAHGGSGKGNSPRATAARRRKRWRSSNAICHRCPTGIRRAPPRRLRRDSPHLGRSAFRPTIISRAMR